MQTQVLAIDIGNIMGVIGMVLSIVGFAYVQAKKPNMILYNFIIICSSGSLLVSLYYRPNLGSIIMEAFWVIGGIVGVILAIIRRKKTILEKLGFKEQKPIIKQVAQQP